MNGYLKCGLFFIGGVVVGAVGATAISRGKLKGLRPVALDILSKGYDIKEKIVEQVDAAREDVSDVLAEAQAQSEARRSAESPVLKEAAEETPAA